MEYRKLLAGGVILTTAIVMIAVVAIDRSERAVTPPSAKLWQGAPLNPSEDLNGSSAESTETIPLVSKREEACAGSRLAFEDAHSVVVSSSVGIPLSRLEISIDDGSWKEVRQLKSLGTKGIALRIPSNAASIRVRAPGHVEQSLSIELTDLELEPDALLTIDLNGIQNHLTRVNIPAGYGEASQSEFGELSTWGFVGSNQFALAVNAQDYATQFEGSDLRFTLQLGAHEGLNVELFLREGLRAQVSLPAICEVRPTAPLDLVVTRNGAEVDGDYTLGIWRIPSGVAAGAREWFFNNGKVSLMDVCMVSKMEVVAGTARMPELVIGDGYRISAFDRHGGAGVVEVRHTGAPVWIDILGGVSVRGTVRSYDRAMPGVIRASWSFGGVGREEEPLGLTGSAGRWIGGAEALSISENGALEIIAARRGFPGRPPRSVEPPSLIQLELLASGFVPWVREIETNHSFEVDLGAIELIPLEPSFILESHPFVDTKSMAYSTVLMSGFDQMGTFEINAAKAISDESWSIYLTVEGSGETPCHFRFRGPNGFSSAPFPISPPKAMVVYGKVEGQNGHVPIGFRLADNSGVPRYQAVPAIAQSIEVDFRGTIPWASEVSLGWTWEGIHVRTYSTRDDLLVPRRFDVERMLPMGSKTLWWTSENVEGRIWPPAHEQSWSGGDAKIVIGG